MEFASIVSLVVGLVVGVTLGGALGLVLFRSRLSTDAARDGASLASAREDAANARADAARQVSLVAGLQTEVARSQADVQRTLVEVARREAELSRRDAEVAQWEAEVADARSEAAEANARTSAALAKVAGAVAERDAAVLRADELAANRDTMVNQFKVLSTETLEKQGQSADVVAQARLKATEDLLLPVAESLKIMNDRINQVELERASATADMRAQIRSVMETGENLRRETHSLVSALRKPQVRGTWGETQLKRVAELAGMVERCDFDVQASTQTVDGTLRPDMTVHLADGKDLFVDSKVPLSAFLDAYEATDDAARDTHLATFARHVKTHIDQLSGKQYWKLGASSPEFVILFLPSDAFLQAAHEQVPDLHEYAARRNIALATPSILIPLLRVVAHGWQQAALAESAAEVSQLGRELFDRLTKMGAHFEGVGRGLTAAVKAYNSTLGSLETRVMVTARKFNELQVTSAELPRAKAVEEPVRELTAPELLDRPDTLPELEHLTRKAPDTLDLLDDAPVHITTRKPITGNSVG